MHRYRSTVLLLVGALLFAPLSACGDDSPDEASDVGTTEATSSATFPVTVQSGQGPVTIDAEPARIVSLSPTLTEMLYAIDADDQVVAVDSNSNYPAGVPKTDLSGFSPNAEAVAGYQPDLVVVSRDRGVVAALGALAIPVLVLESADDLAQVYDQIEVLGDATGHPGAAETLVDSLRTDLDELADRAPSRPVPLRYYYELSAEHSSVTSDTFVGQIMKLAGLESIADDAPDVAGGFPKLSSEFIVNENPAVIFLSYPGSTASYEAVAGRPGWNGIDAITAKRVVVLDPDVASRWGPRLPQFLKAVLDATAKVT